MDCLPRSAHSAGNRRRTLPAAGTGRTHGPDPGCTLPEPSLALRGPLGPRVGGGVLTGRAGLCWGAGHQLGHLVGRLFSGRHWATAVRDPPRGGTLSRAGWGAAGPSAGWGGSGTSLIGAPARQVLWRVHVEGSGLRTGLLVQTDSQAPGAGGQQVPRGGRPPPGVPWPQPAPASLPSPRKVPQSQAEMRPFISFYLFGLILTEGTFPLGWVFREGEGGGREAAMRGTLMGASRTQSWGPGPQPRCMLWTGIEPATLQPLGRHSVHGANLAGPLFQSRGHRPIGPPGGAVPCLLRPHRATRRFPEYFGFKPGHRLAKWVSASGFKAGGPGRGPRF